MAATFVLKEPIKRGDGRTFVLVATYPFSIPGEDIQEGDPFPLNGKTVWFTAKRHFDDDDSEAVIAKKTGEGIEVLPLEAGQTVQNRARITVEPEDTLSLPVRPIKLECDVQVQIGEGDPFTVLEGLIHVKPRAMQVPR